MLVSWPRGFEPGGIRMKPIGERRWRRLGFECRQIVRLSLIGGRSSFVAGAAPTDSGRLLRRIEPRACMEAPLALPGLIRRRIRVTGSRPQESPQGLFRCADRVPIHGGIGIVSKPSIEKAYVKSVPMFLYKDEKKIIFLSM